MRAMMLLIGMIGCDDKGDSDSAQPAAMVCDNGQVSCDPGDYSFVFSLVGEASCDDGSGSGFDDGDHKTVYAAQSTSFAEFTAAAVAVAQKLNEKYGAGVSVPDVCGEMYTSLTAARTQDCPSSYTKSSFDAITAECTNLTNAMNDAEEALGELVYGQLSGVPGVWVDIVLNNTAIESAILYGSMYGGINFGASSVIYIENNGSYDPVIIHQMDWSVPNSIQSAFSTFISATSMAGFTTTYPYTFPIYVSGLTLQAPGSSTTYQGSLSALGLTYGSHSLIDPEDQDQLEAIDQFIALNSASAIVEGVAEEDVVECLDECS